MVNEFIRLGFFGRQIGFVFRSHFKAVNLSGHFYEVMIVMYPIKIPGVRYVILCNTVQYNYVLAGCNNFAAYEKPYLHVNVSHAFWFVQHTNHFIYSMAERGQKKYVVLYS